MPARPFPVLPDSLPFRPEPADGESFLGYLLRWAAAAAVPVPVLAERVGLSTAPGSRRLPPAVGLFLDGGETDRVAAASGLPRPVVDGMHLGRFAPGWLGFDSDTADRRLTLRRLVSHRRVLEGFSRYCPACLTERLGVWSVRWRLVASFACTAHESPLVSECRRCRRPPMPSSHGTAKAPLSGNALLSGNGVPDPHVCATVLSGGRRCGEVYAGPVPAPDPVLAATQRTVDRAIDAGDDDAALDLHALAAVQRAHRRHCKLPPPAGDGFVWAVAVRGDGTPDGADLDRLRGHLDAVRSRFSSDVERSPLVVAARRRR